MIVRAKCSIAKKDFGIVFRRDVSEGWEATRTFKLAPAQAASSGYCEGSMSGIWVGEQYSGCPFCGNRAFFLCQGCNTINCQGAAEERDGKTIVTCVKCGPVALEGEIEKLDFVSA